MGNDTQWLLLFWRFTISSFQINDFDDSFICTTACGATTTISGAKVGAITASIVGTTNTGNVAC